MSRGRNPKHEWEDAIGTSGLRGAPLVVGLWMGRRWNGDHKHPLAPVALVAKETGYSERSVKDALKRLREDGWIAQITRGGRRGEIGWASRYRLTVPNVQSLDPNVQSSAAQGAVHRTHVDQTCRPDYVDHSSPSRFTVSITSGAATPLPPTGQGEVSRETSHA